MKMIEIKKILVTLVMKKYCYKQGTVALYLPILLFLLNVELKQSLKLTEDKKKIFIF